MYATVPNIFAQAPGRWERASGSRKMAGHAQVEVTMAFEYVGVQEAIDRGGLRMIVVGGVPSPWGEAAKGILHIKGIDWVAVRLDYDSEPLKNWAGHSNGPVAIYESER